jgi:hypothetical protein
MVELVAIAIGCFFGQKLVLWPICDVVLAALHPLLALRGVGGVRHPTWSLPMDALVSKSTGVYLEERRWSGLIPYIHGPALYCTCTMNNGD